MYNLKNARNTHGGVSLLVKLKTVPLLHPLKTSEKMPEAGSGLRVPVGPKGPGRSEELQDWVSLYHHAIFTTQKN